MKTSHPRALLLILYILYNMLGLPGVHATRRPLRMRDSRLKRRVELVQQGVANKGDICLRWHQGAQLLG